MKNHYMLTAALRAVVILLSLSLSLPMVHAQNCPPSNNTMPEFEPFTYTQVQSWNTSAWQSFQYDSPDPTAARYMRFRMLSPNNFNRCASDGQKYPLIIFLHGSGESGVYDADGVNNGAEQDNDKHLVHGGQRHQSAVANNSFPGFVIYPQIRKAQNGNNYWGIDNVKAVKYIVDKLIADYKVDPDRIYIHGLSMGGEGSWIFISNYPKYFAAAHPMSAAGTSFWNGIDGYMANYKHIPLRHAQGGLDTAPTKADGNTLVQQIRNTVGGSIRYSYYPNGGHSIWNNEYNKSDFFSWFLSNKKYNPMVFYGQTSFCPGENFSVTLGYTPGFDEYQWTKDNTSNPPFSTSNEVIITQAVSASSGVGTYYGRFRRGAVWTQWSDPIVIDANKGPSPTPSITANGSVNLPPLDGSPEVILSGPTGKAQYSWTVVPSATLPATQNITVSTAGSYTLRSRDAAGTGLESNGETPTEFRGAPQGCLSTASSPIVVTTSNGLGVPAPPANFFGNASTPNSIVLSFDDRSSNETGFEIYRTTTTGSGYKLITILPATAAANPQTYTDNSNIQANTIYYYRMRAVNTAGGSTYTPEIAVNTTVDNVPPSAPVLSLGITSRTEINLSWTGSTDNVGVFEYDIYQNGSMIATVPAATTAYTATGLVAFSTYNYIVKARDLTGNNSAPSNQVSASAINTGLYYKYYHNNTGVALANTGEILTKGTFIKTGVVSNFSVSPRTQTNDFAFIYDGYITIPTTGTYTFYMQSDDGSRLYVNNTLVVNHDNTHSCSERSGTITLSAGSYPIQALYFDNSGSDCLTVRWQGPGISKSTIPDSRLRDNISSPANISTPSGLKTTPPAPTYNTITVSWNDNSNNETGFEVYRSATSSGTYQVINVTAANATSWANTGLNPATTYFYKVRAINATNQSNLTSSVAGTTATVPATPAIPSNLVATPASATQVNLTWTDNSNNEGGFEIQKSSQPSSGFVTLVITAANVTSFQDTQLNGHSTVYYKIRARNLAPNPPNPNTAHSAYTSPAASATTPNRVPTITDIINRSILTGSTATVDVAVADPDTDPITFTFITDGSPGLPAFASFQDDGYGKGTITFTNAVAGTYNITVQGSDGIASASDVFQLSVGTNHPPVLPAIANQTTEEGRVGTTFQFAAATDADIPAQPLTYTVSGLPSFVSFNASNRTFTYNPTVSPPTAGVYSITVTVKDNANPVNGTDSKTFSLIVLPLDNFYTISLNLVSSQTNISGYTPADYYEAAPWNNTGTLGGPDVTNLKDESGNTVRYVTLNGSGWIGGFPATIGLTNDPGTLYTKKVRESFLKRSGDATGPGGSATVLFKNLNPALQYKFTVYGAGLTAGGNAACSLTQYVATGSTSSTVTQSNGNNTTTVSTTSPVFPNASGQITLSASRAPGVTTGAVYLNAVIVTAQYPAPTPPDAPSGLTLTAPAYNTVNVSWTDNSFNEASFEILRSPTLNGTYNVVAGGSVPANTTTFVDNSVTGRTTYYYKVRAVNGFGPSASTNALVITTPNGAPVIADPGTITVRVGETIQHNISATDPEGDPITFSTQNLPAFATLVDNGNGTGFIRVIPQQNDIGSYPFTLQAIDNLSAQTEIGANIIVLDAEIDEAVFINFKGSGAASNAMTPWNNKATADNSALVNASGQPSAIQITGGGWTGANTGGMNTGANSGLYPDNVIQSFWTSTGTGTITLTGLDNNKRYNIAIMGSRNEFWFGNTVYSITTGTPTGNKTLNTTKNKSNIIRFTGIQPTSGIIAVTAAKGPNLNTGPTIANRDACINGMVIESYTPGTTPRKPTNLVAEGISKTAIKLTWQDNSSNETGFEISRAANQGGSFTFLQNVAANVETFTDLTVPQNTAFIYRVRALGTSNSGYTNDAMATSFQQIILVNLNYSTAGGHQQAPSPWNNTAQVPIEGSTFNNLINDAAAATTVDLSIVTQGSGSGNETGYDPVPADNPVYPDQALVNYYYYEQFEAPNQYLLSQLDPNYTYDLVFLGNEWTAATLASIKVATNYTVGTTTISQFNGKNVTDRVFIKGITPESDNTIGFEIGCHDEARYGVWNTLEIRSYTPLSATFDTEPPSIPQNLVASDVTDVSFQVAWSPSTDNIGVSSYEVFLGSELKATINSPDTFAIITDLQPSTTYSVSVRAVDVKGNRSGFSNALQVTTLPSSTEATTYYPQAGDITQTATWNTEEDGSGSNPINFTLNNQHFMLTRNADVNSAWTISGTNSKLIVDTLFSLTINNTLTAIVDVLHNASAIINSSTAPTFGTLAPTSTITFNANPNTIPGANYGNLVLGVTGSSKQFASGNYFVNGDMQIADGVTLNGSTGNNTILNISGNLTLTGNAGAAADNQLLSVRFSSGATQTITSTTGDVRFYNINVAGNTQLNIAGGTTAKTITLGTSNGGGLLVESGSVFTLGKNNLVIEGTGTINPLDEPGQIRVSKGDIGINSTGTQISNLYFGATADTVKALRMNANPSGQVNIRAKLYIDDVIDLTNGRLNSNDQIVLVSDADHTARVGKIGGSGSLIGKVEFQRYFDPKGRIYRYVSAPVVGSTVANWMTYFPVVGPFTGSKNFNTINSLYYFDNNESDNDGWIGYPTSTSQEAFAVGRGYSLFVFDGSLIKKLRITGPIQQGNFTFPNLATDLTPETNDTLDITPFNGWNLLGNPYASPIQWGNGGWQATGIHGSVYVRSNEIVNGTLVSSVKYWNGTIGTLPKGIITQGQSFWVKSTGMVEPALTITEDAKYDTIRSVLQRVASPRNFLEITLANSTLNDKAFIQFNNQATDGVDVAIDALKLPNSYFNLSSRAGNTNLAINNLPASFCNRTIPLSVRNAAAGNYTLTFQQLESFDYAVEIKLIDHFSHTETVLAEGSTYSFDVTGDAASYGNNRFEVSIGKPTLDESTAFTTASSGVCGSGSVQVTLNSTQAGARYKIVRDEQVIQEVTGNGNSMTVNIGTTSLQGGDNILTIRAAFDGCTPVTLATTTTVQYTLKPDISVQDGALVSSSATGNQWLLEGNPITGATNATYVPEVSGEYAVRVSGSTCDVSSDPVLFAITGTELDRDDVITLYPNPVKTRFLVKLNASVQSGETIAIQLYNAQGMIVGNVEKIYKQEGVELSAIDLASGLYTIRIETGKKQFEKRFIKE